MKADEITVRPDAKGRITLGNLARGVSSFRVHRHKDGRLVLEPFREVPAREAWLYESPESLAKLRQGLADAADGKLESRGDFSSYADEPED